MTPALSLTVTITPKNWQQAQTVIKAAFRRRSENSIGWISLANKTDIFNAVDFKKRWNRGLDTGHAMLRVVIKNGQVVDVLQVFSKPERLFQTQFVMNLFYFCKKARN